MDHFIVRYVSEGKMSIHEVLHSLGKEFDSIRVWNALLAPTGRHVRQYKSWTANASRIILFPDHTHEVGSIRACAPCKIQDGNLLVQDECQELVFGFSKDGKQVCISSWMKSKMKTDDELALIS